MAIGVHRGQARPSLGQPLAHRPLVLGEAQRAGAGVHRHAVGRQRRDVLVGDVLVVEGQRVAAAGEGAQIVQRAVVSDDIGRDEAAPSSAESARMRSDWPSAIAAWWVIRASCPAPTMPTIGSPVRSSRARPRGAVDGPRAGRATGSVRPL